MYVGPSQHAHAWRAFFTGRSWEPQLFADLVERDEIGAAFFEIETQINGLYRSLQMSQALAQRFGLSVDEDRRGEVELNSRRQSMCPIVAGCCQAGTRSSPTTSTT